MELYVLTFCGRPEGPIELFNKLPIAIDNTFMGFTLDDNKLFPIAASDAL